MLLKEINSEYTKEHGIDKLLSILKTAEKKLLDTHKSIDSVPYNGVSESFFNLDENSNNNINNSKNNLKSKLEKISSLLKEIKKIG